MGTEVRYGKQPFSADVGSGYTEREGRVPFTFGAEVRGLPGANDTNAETTTGDSRP
jgi:hypothetical protein